jgi:hypothetical protein
MTWIVGTQTPFGFAFAASDVRVTFHDGTTRDCLQKIYGVGNFIALGFAGSVTIGFKMVGYLARLLSQAGPTGTWYPKVVAEWWQNDAMDVFYDSPPAERNLGCALIMLGADPSEDTGFPGWAKTYVYTFSSPRFEPRLAGADAVTSIGSGSASKPYQDALEQLRASEKFYELAVMHRGMQIALGTAVSRAVLNNPTSGVSELFQLCTVERAGVEIGHVGEMPSLARTHSEFLKVSEAQGASAELAIC